MEPSSGLGRLGRFEDTGIGKGGEAPPRGEHAESGEVGGLGTGHAPTIAGPVAQQGVLFFGGTQVVRRRWCGRCCYY